MPLPTELIELVHTKLLLTYGAAWKAAQGGLTADVVRKHWATELDGLDAHRIAHGLRNLPADRVPNVLQFRALCTPPATPAKRLANWSHVPMSAAVRERIEHIKAAIAGQDRFSWAHNLRRREENGERLSLVQREAWRRALRVNRKESDDGNSSRGV